MHMCVFDQVLCLCLYSRFTIASGLAECAGSTGDVMQMRFITASLYHIAEQEAGCYLGWTHV